MIEQIFSQLQQTLDTAAISHPVSIYFSIEGIRKTVFLTPDCCRVVDGRELENADCVCKTSADFFLKVWNQGYRPGMGDFLSGAIKSNNPAILQNFLSACGKG